MTKKTPAFKDPFLTDAGVARASITVAAEITNVCNVAIQLKDGNGVDLAVRGAVIAYISDNANGDDVAVTAPDTVAIGTDGVAIPIVAGKHFLLISESDGDIDLNVTKSGADDFYLNLVLPDGSIVTSSQIHFT